MLHKVSNTFIFVVLKNHLNLLYTHRLSNNSNFADFSSIFPGSKQTKMEKHAPLMRVGKIQKDTQRNLPLDTAFSRDQTN